MAVIDYNLKHLAYPFNTINKAMDPNMTSHFLGQAASLDSFAAENRLVQSSSQLPVGISIIPGKLAPRQELFRACGYLNWNDKEERKHFLAMVNPVVGELFDGERTWHTLLKNEQAECVNKFLVSTGVKYNSFKFDSPAKCCSVPRRICEDYLRQYCDNHRKHQKRLSEEGTPRSQVHDGHRSPLPPSTTSPANGLLISPNNDDLLLRSSTARRRQRYQRSFEGLVNDFAVWRKSAISTLQFKCPHNCKQQRADNNITRVSTLECL